MAEGNNKRTALLIIALIGGILTMVGAFLSWWFFALIFGFVVIVGSLLSLVDASGAPMPKAVNYMLPVGGIAATIVVWGDFIISLILLGRASSAFWGLGFTYSFYFCLIGSVLPVICYFTGGRKPEPLTEWGRTQSHLGTVIAATGLAVPFLAWIIGGLYYVIVTIVPFTMPCLIVAGILGSRGSSARYRGECEEIEAEVHRALKSKREVTFQEIASKTGIKPSKVSRRVLRWIRKGRLPGVYVDAGVLTTRRGAPSRARGAPEFKPAQIEQMVYGYIVNRGGEIDIAKCAKELGISRAKVEAAIEALEERGKLER